MRKCIVGTLFAFALVLGAAEAQAQSFDTVNWASDGSPDGLGAGTLSGGTIAVNYITASGAQGNSGDTFSINWNTCLATASGVGSGVNNLLAGTLGELGGSQTQTIQFSGNVTNPILLVNFADSDSTFTFGAIPISLLSSHNAQLAGGVVTFSGASNSFDDGFAAQLTGTFGPSTPLVFQSTATGGDSQTFTVGLALTSVPEPGTYALIGSLGLTGAAFLRRKRTR